MSKQENKQEQYEVNPAVTARIVKNIEDGDSLYWASHNGAATIGFDKNGNGVMTCYTLNPQLPQTIKKQGEMINSMRDRIINPDKTPADHYARMLNEIKKLEKNGLGAVAEILKARYPEQNNEKALGE